MMPSIGTAGLVAPINSMGAFPSYNATKGVLNGWEKISGETMASIILERGGKTTHMGCAQCIVHCSNEFEDKEGKFVTSSLEYETIWAMGGIPILEIDPLVCPKFSSTMRVIALIEDSDVIKKVLKHLNHWNFKGKPRSTANLPPIDVFPTYDDQPEPGVDEYITDPDYSAEAYFKTTIEQQGFLCPKFRLDNTTGIRYLDSSRLLPQYGC